MALAACDDTTNATAGERWCEGFCTAVNRCGFHPQSCVGHCVIERPNLSKLSVGVTDAQVPCLSTLSCNALTGDEAAWRAETDVCWREAVMSVVATTRSRDFCTSHARFIFDCGYIFTLEDCAQNYAIWSDDMLARFALCETTATCETLKACEQRAQELP